MRSHFRFPIRARFGRGPTAFRAAALHDLRRQIEAYASGPGPGAHGPTRPGWALALSRAQTLCGIWAAGPLWRPFLRTSRPALAAGPLPLGASARARGPRPACRRPGPSLGSVGPFRASPGPGLPCRPPAPPLGLSSAGAPTPAPPGARWPRLPRARPRFAAGSLAGDRSPLRRLGLPRWAARGPAGGRLRARFAASGPGAPRPAPGAGPLPRPFLGAGAGRFWAARAALAALAGASPAVLCWLLGSPCLPPAPAAPLGLSGCAWPPA